MYYFLEILASVAFAMQFMVMKFYQKHTETNLASSLVFAVVYSLVGAVPFFALNGFTLHATPFTLLVALSIGIISVLSTLCSIRIVYYGKLSIYSLFLMLGSMVLPFFFGVLFLGEPVNVVKGVAVVLMGGSLVLSSLDTNDKGERMKAGFILLCAAAFTLNGLSSVAQSVHSNASVWGQTTVDDLFGPTVGLYDFTIWVRLMTVGCSVVSFPLVLLHGKDRRRAELASVGTIFRPKPLLGAAGYALANLAGFSLQMISVAHVPTSVLFPMSTGVTIIASTLLARVMYKEKITRPVVAGLVMTAIAAAVFILGDMLL